MRVLVDTSIWIDYFRSGDNSKGLDYLIDENFVFTNDLILTELIPSLRLKNQKAIIGAIGELSKLPLSINWQEIQEFQFKCLKAGINGVGIPDLLIAQNAKQTNSYIFSLDQHFGLFQEIIGFEVYA